MGKFNPCCCAVEKGLKAIGIVQVVKSVVSGIAGALLLIAIIHLSGHEDEHHVQIVSDSSVIGTLIVSLLLSVWELALGIILLKGAATRNHAKCRLWLLATAVGALVYLVIFIVATATSGSASASSIILYFLGLGVDIYCMVVVFAFLDELTSDPSAVGYNV